MPDNTTAAIRVRLATLADSVNVTKFCLKTGAWDGRSGHTNETRAYQFVFGLINRGLVAIADLSGNVVGSIGVLAIQPSHTEEWAVYVDWLKVQSHLKDSGIATSLLRFALKVARKGNSDLMLNLGPQDIEQIGGDALQELGFAPANVIYARKADATEQPRAEQPAKPAAEPQDRPAVGGEPESGPRHATAEPVQERRPTADLVAGDDSESVGGQDPAPDAARTAVLPGRNYRLADGGPTEGQLRAAKFRARREAQRQPGGQR